MKKILAILAGGIVLAGCLVDDDDPDAVVTPGDNDTTIIDKGDAPDVNVTPPAPKIDIKTDPPPGGTVTTTGQ